MAETTVIQYVLNLDAGKATQGVKQLSSNTNQLDKSITSADRATNKMNSDLKKTDRQARETSKGLGGLNKSLGGLGSQMGAIAAGIAIAGAGFVAMQQKIADLSNELVDASTKTGIAVDTLAGLRLAAEGSGLQFSNLESGLIKFQQSMDNASRGSSTFADKFDQLGVSVTNANGELRDTDSVFNEVIGALGDMENATERNAAAMQIFGRQAGPALIQSGALTNLQDMTAFAKEFGISLEDNAIDGMANFQRAMAEFETVAVGVMNNLISAIAGPNGAGDAIQLMSKAFVFVGSVAETVIGVIGQGFENMFGVVQAAILALSGDIGLAGELIKSLQADTSRTITSLGNIFDTANRKVAKFETLSSKPKAPEKFRATAKAASSAAESIDKVTESTERAEQANDRLNDAIAAREALLRIERDLVVDTLSETEKIEYQRQQELKNVIKLGKESNNVLAASRSILLINQKYDALLDEINQKQEGISQELKLQQQLSGLLQGLEQQIRAPTLEGVVELSKESADTFAEVTAEGSSQVAAAIAPFAAQISAALGAALTVIGLAIAQVAVTTAALSALEQLGQKTPEQRRQENRDRAESIKQGLEFLPEIILSVIPQLAIGIAEAVVDGFILALRSFADIIKDSFTSVFTREGREQRREQGGTISNFLRDFFDPSVSAAFAGGGSFIPAAQGGMRFTGQKRSGLALLHQGEFVVPQSGQKPQAVERQMQSSSTGGINIVINSQIVERSAIDALVRRIEERFNSNFGLASSNLFGGR